jgi:DNA-directed RNA polymerase specialized sigma24 family protein
MDHGFQPTSLTLLAKLAAPQGSEEWKAAWERFVRQYGPPILSLCRRYRVRSSDLQDVSQQILLRLLSAMGRFASRRWLRVVLVQSFEGLLGELETAAPEGDERHMHEALLSIGRVAGTNESGSSVRKKTPALLARQVLEELKPHEEEMFARRWWQAGASIWHDSRPSFHDLFAPLLNRCLAKWGLDATLVEEASLALEVRIDRVLDTLDQDSLPPFRNWLTAVVRNAAKDCVQQVKKMAPTFTTLSLDEEVGLDDGGESFIKELERREIRVEAERRVFGRVSERHWVFYSRMVHDDWTAPQVAQHFHTTTGSVYMAVKRIRDKVIEEVHRLEDQLSGAADAEES